MSNYNGTVNVAFAAGTGTLSTGTVTLTNGTGTFTISGSTTGTDTIDSSALTESNGANVPSTLAYGSATVTAVSPTIAGIQVSATTQAISENTPTEDVVSVTLTDQAGNTIPSTYASEGAKAVTVTLNGPGSLGSEAATIAGATTSQSVYVWPGYTGNVDVWSIQGQPGPITVTATAPGLTPGQATINAVTVGQPAKIAVSATSGSLTSALTVGTDTLPSGTSFTEYTVTLEDVNGNAVAAPSAGDALTLSDNATTGSLFYYAANSSGQPTGSALPATSGSYSGSIASGTTTYSFDVINTTTQTSPATITVADALTSSTVSVPYAFETGAASQVGVSGPGDVVLNGTATYTAQVEDAAGNAVTDGAAPVTFTLSGAPSGVTFANGSSTYVTTLNSAGAATVTVDAGTTTGTYDVYAAVSGLTSGLVTGTVTTAGSYVSQIGLYSGAIGAPSASAVIPSSGVSLTGLQTAQFTLFEENAVDQAQPATDNLTITSSNPSVVMVGATSATPVSGGVLTLAATSFTSTSGTFSLIGGDQGTATITVKDASNPTVAPVTFTVTVGSLSSGAISATAAGESGAANATSGLAYFTLPGSTTVQSATYASSASDFGSYNNGVFTITPPALYSAVAAPSGSSATSAASGDTLAVWPGATSGSYYYVDLSQETPGAGSQLGHAYVGLNIQGPTGSTVTLSVNGGSYDTNTGNVDQAYLTVATEASVGSWTLASPTAVQLNAKVTFANGVTVTYPLMVQEP